MPKRKRGSTSYKKTGWMAGGKATFKSGKRPRTNQQTAMVVPGRTRTSGFYGRYTGDNPEVKFLDTTNTFQFDSTGEVPATGQLALIPQGDTESTRDGRVATIKSIHIKGALTLVPAALGLASGTTYMILVLDKQCNGAAAAIGDVLTGNSMALSFNNLANSERFTILKKWAWDWNPAAGVTAAFNNQSKHMDYFKKVDIPMHFSGTTGAITEIRSNNIFLLAGSVSTIDDYVYFSGATRIRFTG